MGRKITFKIISCSDNAYNPGAEFGRGDVADMLKHFGLAVGTIIRDQRKQEYYVVTQGRTYLYLRECDVSGQPKDEGAELKCHVPAGDHRTLAPIGERQ